MKKISKVLGGLLLIAGISACSNSNRNLLLVVAPIISTNNIQVYVNDIDTIKGFVPTPNPNATMFNYTITGDLAGCQVATFDSAGNSSGLISNNSSGTTYDGLILVGCENLGAGTYTGTVSISTTSGGYNYSGSIPVTITF
ncbi:hypothetical protein [Francisella hispaniensis]|uniref:hypothetical protein n=1 Tax=Francisella hispaniensis TaxID=622488 RepID=UPI001907C722|nr:hypothetical protein [Francisella hispaniensis]MBK2357273.1 hypothetical protein [Francisella hispaniensis]